MFLHWVVDGALFSFDLLWALQNLDFHFNPALFRDHSVLHCPDNIVAALSKDQGSHTLACFCWNQFLTDTLWRHLGLVWRGRMVETLTRLHILRPWHWMCGVGPGRSKCTLRLTYHVTQTSMESGSESSLCEAYVLGLSDFNVLASCDCLAKLRTNSPRQAQWI